MNDTNANNPADNPAQAHSGVPVSILVLTKDEQINIEACLQCLSFSDDVVVLDSYSTDRTVEIAKQFPNVRVVQRRFDTWSRHSNWALENIDFKYPWVYYSDADERVTQELRDEINRTIRDPNQTNAAFRVRYKNMFLGRWLRHGGIYPVWIIRLFQPDKVRYEDRQVNAHPVVDGSIGELKEHFIHYSFNKGLGLWFQKHNAYSSMESHEAVSVRHNKFNEQLRLARSEDRATRRRAIKNMSFFLPGRALFRFLYMYFLKLGFLDGRAGFHYAALISMYEYWIEVKIREQEQEWSGRTKEVVGRLLQETGA